MTGPTVGRGGGDGTGRAHTGSARTRARRFRTHPASRRQRAEERGPTAANSGVPHTGSPCGRFLATYASAEADNVDHQTLRAASPQPKWPDHTATTAYPTAAAGKAHVESGPKGSHLGEEGAPSRTAAGPGRTGRPR